MFYAINHTTHSLHTIKAGSATEAMLAGKQPKKGRRVFVVESDRYSAFQSHAEVLAFQALLMLCGAQG